MSIIREYFAAVLGMVIFLTAFGLAVLNINSIDSSVAATKQDYADDSAYSEASLEVSDEGVIDREELVAMLMRSPGRDVVVRDDVSGYTLKIVAGAGLESIVTIERDGVTAGERESRTVNFGKDRWNIDQLKLDEYLQAERYRKKDITFSNGNLKSVMFYGE